VPLELTQEDFLAPEWVRALKEHCRARASQARCDGRGRPVRDWAILHVALDSGLRVSEICDLLVGDLLLDPGRASLIVRDGKGHKKRGVRLGEALRRHLSEFLRWKARNGESIDPEAPLFLSARTGDALTRTAVYRLFKQYARAVGIPSRYSIHSCRHTYASLLYRASEFNLRLVQKQLGHRSIQTTQVYADVLDEDTATAVNRLPQ
jgi:site-specific recombinase XerD